MRSLKTSIEIRVKDLGLKRGWQAKLAQHCGVAAPSVHSWVHGNTHKLEGDHLLKAAHFFKCSPSWLAGHNVAKTSDTGLEVETSPSWDADTLSDPEIRLVRLFREANRQQKNWIIGSVKGALIAMRPNFSETANVFLFDQKQSPAPG